MSESNNEVEPLIWEKQNDIAVLTLNRPKAMNSFDLDLMAEHRRRLEEFEADKSLRVLIYTGVGRAFSTGIDIKKAPDFLHWKAEDRHRTWVTPYSMEISKPTIAVFGLPEVLLGALPGGGGTQTLPRLIGLGDALLMMLTGESVDAVEALRLRLVQKVVPADQLLDEAIKIGEAICRGGKNAVPLIKEVATEGLKMSISEALWLEQVYFQRNREEASEEIAERLRAFQDRSKKGKS